MAYAAEQGSPQNLKRLVMMIPSMPVTQLRHVLPVFYANLDPAAVPTTDELDDIVETMDYGNSVQRAYLALDALAKLLRKDAVPVDAYQTLWFPQSMPTRVAYGTYLDLIISMLDNPPTAKIVSATSGVRHLLIQLIDGAGGTLRHVADLTVKHLTYLIPMARGTSIEKTRTTGSFSGLLSFIEGVSIATSQEDIGVSLLAQGFLATLVCFLRALDLRVIVPPELLGPYLSILKRFIVSEPDPQWVVEALRAGLIDLIGSLVGHPLLPKPTEDVCYLLSFLASTTVYYSVLAEIEGMSRGLDEVLDQNDPAIMRSPVFDAWRTFTESVEERQKTKQLFDFDESPSLLACDNTECNKVSEKWDFKRCAGCKYMSYCSRDCQKRDWKQGKHREECQKNRLADSSCLVKQNRAFLRALVHHDYETRRDEVLEKQVEFEHKNPGTKFYTLFDYTERRVPIHIVPLTKKEDRLEVAQMSKSQASMELHAALVARGRGKQAFLFLMRSSGASIPNAETLVRIHI
ncbi:MYND-type domain-containing protein [Mycena sanguinolenta]|uniref:MYND-type domain-containing protein n=1 Tax=Mycena sanguinolenta TaxID=230812 RepID=A0A8H7CPI3_9AGAR|nr:MYND-type domain-containing protein [Mycena sanguinolenta]